MGLNTLNMMLRTLALGIAVATVTALDASALAEGSPTASSPSPWTRVPQMIYPQDGSFSGRANIYAAGVNGKVYAMGGDGDTTERSTVIYDPATKEWSFGPEMMHRAQTDMTSTVSVVGDNIYL